MYRYDNRVVITLDAGGTNLVFGAMQANKFIVDPITLPSNADNLDKCLATMVEGFQAVIDKLEETLKELKTRRPDKKNPYRAIFVRS